MPLMGNKGEWSEAYVLLRLLGQGRIYAADENIDQIKEMYFPILKIIREELANNRYEYAVKDDSLIEIYLNDNLIKTIDGTRFSVEADYLYKKIVAGGNRTFAIERTETFLDNIGCHRLAAPSHDKIDITMQIHDIQTGYEPICGFSIKSEIGSAPTLVNATGATNFIFEVKGLSKVQIEEINAIETRTKIRDRMERIFSEAKEVVFIATNSETFANNLMFIDSQFGKLLAYSLIYHYRDNITNCADIVEKLEYENPLAIPTAGFYRHKYKEFLCSAALGMTPTKAWDGTDDANGGYVIVTATGNVLAFHIYNRDFFKSYLLNNTKYERASTKKHNFASLYNENDRIYIKLNLQIRFI